jgi:hypothetical protein
MLRAMRRAIPAFVLYLFSNAACSPAPERPVEPPSPPPTDTPPTPTTPEPPDEAPTRPSLTADECTAKGGSVVGDIGDGATQRPDYVCASGGAPLGNIKAPEGGPMGVEGSVCCPGGSGAGTGLDPAWTTCKADADCALVETACCDHCNGGKAVAVNKAHVADAGKLRPACGPTACTKRGCTTRAACDKGTCVLQNPPLGL